MRIPPPLAPLAASALLLAAGCATAPQPARDLTNHAPPAGEPPLSEPAPTNTPLGLNRAFALALVENPALAAFSYEVRAAEARLLQARARPNPKLRVGLEEFDRDGAGLDSSELEIELEQKLELGGKRRWRTDVAAARGELTDWDYAAKRLNVLADTTTRFVAVAAAQARVELVAQAVELAEETHRAVGERVEAGKEPALQAAKSESELQLVRMAALDADDALRIARRRLAIMWGARIPTFPSVDGQLEDDVTPPPPLNDLRNRLPHNPRLARGEAQQRLHAAAVSAARAARLPNLSASVALQRYQEDDSDALAFGVGLPLPLFDRNRGNIGVAEQQRDQSTVTLAAAALELDAELATTHTAWSAAHRRVEALRHKIIPNMEAAFAGAQEGYRQGKFTFLDMLDSQRILFDARGSLLDAVTDYHSQRAEANRLAPAPLDLNPEFAQEMP